MRISPTARAMFHVVIRAGVLHESLENMTSEPEQGLLFLVKAVKKEVMGNLNNICY